jgi:integrase
MSYRTGSNIEHVVTRRHRLHFRRRIPTAVQVFFDGQTEAFIELPPTRKPQLRRIVRELSTEFDRCVAGASHNRRVGRFDSGFLDAVLARVERDQAEPPDAAPDTPAPKHLRPEDIELLAEHYRCAHLAGDELMRFGVQGENALPLTDEEFEQDRALLETAARQLRTAQARGDTSLMREAAVAFLENEGFVVNLADELFRHFEKRLLQADVQAVELQLKRAQGESVVTPPAPHIDNPELMMGALRAHWEKARKPTAKTITESHAAVRLYEQFCTEVHGRPLAVDMLTKDIASAFRDWLLTQVPRKHRATGQTMDAGSARKYLGLLTAYVNAWIQDRECDIRNVLQEIARPAKPKNAGRPRTAFQGHELQKLFSHERFASLYQHVDGFHRDAYWLILCALFTGARLESLGGLKVEEVYQFDGRHFFRFRVVKDNHAPGSARSIHQATHTVPVHRTLVALGFLEHLAQARAAGGQGGALFRYLKADSHGSRTGYFSKWFGRLLNEVGLDDPRLVFHSFRHTFKDIGRMCEIPKGVLDVLTSHKSKEVGDSYGADNYPIAPLIKALDRFHLGEVDLSHLMPQGASKEAR